MATTKMAVATALNGAKAMRSESVATKPSLEGGGYAASGTGNGMPCGTAIIDGRYWVHQSRRNRPGAVRRHDVKPVGITVDVNARILTPAVRLDSVRVGRPRTVDDEERWVTAFFKSAVDGPVLLLSTNLEGDRQADLRVHGGADKAVCVYSGDHYPAWRDELRRPDMGAGGFGENFTVRGQTESDVCLGDRFAVGEAVVEVSQPRGPCSKLARRWDRLDLPKLVVASGRSGWYLRVVDEGLVQAGQSLQLLQRPFPEWTITRVNDVTYGLADATDAERGELASCPALARSWQRTVGRRL